MICPRGCKDAQGEPVELPVYSVKKGAFVNRRQRICPVCGYVSNTVELEQVALDVFYQRQKEAIESALKPFGAESKSLAASRIEL